MLDTLLAELGDVIPQELEVSLISRDGVGQVILDDFFLSVADETTDSLDARGALQVLSLDLEIEKASNFIVLLDANGLENSHKNLFKALEIPVLVNACVSDP